MRVACAGTLCGSMSSIRTETETVIKRILPYLRRRGYDPETDIDFETAVTSTTRYAKGYVDLLVTCGKTRQQFLIEAKRSSKRLTVADRDQALDYARSLRVPFVIVTNGSDTEAYNVQSSEAIRWDGKLVAKVPSKDQLPLVLRYLRSNAGASVVPLSDDDSLPFRPGLPLKQLNALFQRCHNAIRKIEKNEEFAFSDLSKILFLKLLEEKADGPGAFDVPYSYRFYELAERPDPEADQVKDAVQTMLRQIRAAEYGDVLVESIRLRHPKTYQYIVRQLASVSFTDSGLDTKGAAFEYFVRATLKGKRLGQYFTPRPLVELMVTMVGRYGMLDGVTSGTSIRVIDPACGTGGFLVYMMKDLLAELDRRLGVRAIPRATRDRLADVLRTTTFYGSDANEGVAAAAKMNMIIAGDGHTNIKAEDSLKANAVVWNWDEADADYILTNPPFGTSESDSLADRDLSHYPVTTTKGQHLFLQRMVTSTKPGGLICTVIDEGVLNTGTASGLRRWLLQNADVIAVVRLPVETFQPNKINVKSSVLLMRKLDSPDSDLERGHRIVLVSVESLGYLGSGEAVRGFDFERLRADFSGPVFLADGADQSSGPHWRSFAVDLSSWASDESNRLDFKYWEPEIRERLLSISSSARPIRAINLLPTKRGRSPAAETYVDRADGYALVVKAGTNISRYGDLVMGPDDDYIEKSAFDELPARVKLENNDVLLASTGDGTLGKACVFEAGIPAVADGHVTIIRPDRTQVNPHYLADYLRVGFGQDQIKRLFTGSTGLIELTPDDVDSILVELPPTLDEQRLLAQTLRGSERLYLEAIEEAKALLQQSREGFIS